MSPNFFVGGISSLENKKSSKIEYLTVVLVKLIDFGKFALVGLVTILCAGYLKDVFIAFAGKKTLADIRFLASIGINGNFLDLKPEKLIAAAGGVVALLGGLLAFWMRKRERRLRRATIREMSKKIIKLEKRIDPNRSSSLLTETGDTRPEDL